jgi:hypothetical protein
MSRQGVWRRFVPHHRGRLNDQTAYEPDSLYARARQIAQDALHQVRSISEKDHSALARTSRAAALLRRRETHDAAYCLALLLLQTPGAARAQDEMDAHRGGYRNREARLFELIDFNDTFVDAVLVLDRSELAVFRDRLRHEQTVFCSQLGVQNFDERQFEAIVHGLSREIAVYLGAKKEGFLVRMTSRVQDAHGVDMVVTDPRTKKSINIDVKTHSAFHFRLIDLERQRRITEDLRLQCELAGFCAITDRRNSNRVETVLLRIATDRLSEIDAFEFVDTAPLGELLHAAIANEGKYIV